jgi:hypothetical protein
LIFYDRSNKLLLQLGLLRRIAKRRSNIALYADELGKGFVGELDYTLEASNASIFLVSKIYIFCGRRKANYIISLNQIEKELQMMKKTKKEENR